MPRTAPRRPGHAGGEQNALSQGVPFPKVALLAGLALALGPLGLLLAVPAALQLWIGPQTPPLGRAFVAAWLAGGTAPLVWVGLTGRLTARRALMLTVLVAFAGTGRHLFARDALPGNERYLPFAVGAIVAAAVLGLVGRLPLAGERSVPAGVRWALPWCSIVPTSSRPRSALTRPPSTAGSCSARSFTPPTAS